MKKTKIFFLALLCLFGKEVYGQEVASHPESPADEVGGAPVVVFGQIKSKTPITQVDVKYWENPLDLTNDAPSVAMEQVTISRGKMQEGTYGDYIFRWDGHIQHPTKISFYSPETFILEEYVIFPGDSIKIYLDTYSHLKVFSGPSQGSFELQGDLERVLKKNVFSGPVKLIFGDASSYFTTEQEYEKFRAHQAHGFGRKVEFLSPDPELLFNKFLTESEFRIETGNVTDMVKNYSGVVHQKKLDYICASSLAKIYQKHISALGRLRDNALKDENFDLALKIEESARENFLHPLMSYEGKDVNSPYSRPLYSLIEMISGQDGESLIEKGKGVSLSGVQTDQIIAIDFFWKFRKGKHSYEYLGEVAENIGTPSIQGLVLDFLEDLRPGKKVKCFDFWDEKGARVSEQDIRGSYVLVSTYFTGCSASSHYYQSILSPLMDRFGMQPDFKVVTISIDPMGTVWGRSLANGGYTDARAINLNTGKSGHPFLLNYHLKGFPSQLLIDPEGRLLQVPGLKVGLEELTILIEEKINSQPIQ